jgi:carbon storage regulator CsrA
MLVLTRKLNQQIRIGDDVTITVLRVKGNTIRIGVEAPRNVRVVRGELQPLSQRLELEIPLDALIDQGGMDVQDESEGEPAHDFPTVNLRSRAVAPVGRTESDRGPLSGIVTFRRITANELVGTAN